MNRHPTRYTPYEFSWLNIALRLQATFTTADRNSEWIALQWLSSSLPSHTFARPPFSRNVDETSKQYGTCGMTRYECTASNLLAYHCSNRLVKECSCPGFDNTCLRKPKWRLFSTWGKEISILFSPMATSKNILGRYQNSITRRICYNHHRKEKAITICGVRNEKRSL